MGLSNSSRFKEKIKREHQEQKLITEKVENAPIKPIGDDGEIARRFLSEISDDFRSEISSFGFTEPILERIRSSVEAKCNKLDADYEKKKRIERLVMLNITGLGPIEPFMNDDTITEIVVQKYDNICIERRGKVYKVDTAFMDEHHLVTIINRIVQSVGRQVTINMPMVDARLQDGSRVNATIPPATPDGATLTIRKFSKVALTGEDYLGLGSLNEDMLTFLSRCVEGKISMIVSGGTNTGKTTLLNMLSNYIPNEELIITIEDSCELKLNQDNVRRMETRPSSHEGLFPVTIQSLVKNALRMRPDRIVVGEVRDETVVDMMSAMSTGHEGSLSTVHANSPRNLVDVRLPILYSMYQGTNFSEEAQAMQIAEALHIIVQIDHAKDGKRYVTHITHVKGLREDKRVDLKDIFVFNKETKEFRATGYVPEEILELLRARNIEIDKQIFKGASRCL